MENIEEKNKLLLRFADNIALHNGIHVHPVLLAALNYDYDLAVLVSQYSYVSTSKGGQEFLYQNDNFLFSIGSLDKIKKAKAKAVKLEIISVTLKGLPARSYIKVNHDKIDALKIAYVQKTYESLTKWQQTSINTGAQQDGVNPHYWTVQNGTTNNKDINKDNIKENIKRKADPMNENPASGSPSSPNVDESQTYDSIFESFWDKVQYKAQKANAYAQWKKLTNNSKSQKTIKEVEEGYERYVSFLAKERARGFKDRQHMEMSRFLNPKNLLWKEDWKTEQEQRQEQQQVQTENQKYWEEHENKTSFKQYKKVEEPKNWKERIGIAGKLGLLNQFSREEIRELFDITEWKFVPADIKQVIASKEIERIVSENEEKTNKLFYEYNCFSMMGKLGYLRARDVYNEETGKELEYALESYAPDQDNYDKNVWGWLVQYGLSFGKPNLENPTVPKSWIKENPGRRGPFTNFLIYV